MTPLKEAGVEAASLVERLRELIGQYFDLGYAEGATGRDVDTKAGEAQAAWSEIDALISRLEPDRIEQLQRQLATARTALTEIAEETEVHTKLSQERLCCKFQDIAAAAIRSLQSEGGKP